MKTFKEYAELRDKSESSWFMPDLEQEKEELIRQANELNIPENKIIKAFPNGKLITLNSKIWNEMLNTESNNKDLNWKQIDSWKEKDVNGIKKALKDNTPLPAPIVLNYKNKYYCVAGNTRLSIAKLMNITPKVWMIKHK